MSAVEPGSFRVRNDPRSSYYRATIEVAYVEGADPAVIDRALTDCYHEARAELTRRFTPQDDHRQQSAATG